MRGLAAAISSTLERPATVSIVGISRTLPARTPLRPSNSAISESTARSCWALSAIGSTIPARPGPTTASRSAAVRPVPVEFTRTQMFASAPRSRSVLAASTRAAGFADSATASSRSTM